MGHIHLLTLPTTKLWKDVAALLIDGAEDQAVIAASARAAEKDLLAAASDTVFVEAVRLLLSIPHAARSADFGQALREADLRVGSSPGLIEIVTAASARLDETAAQTVRRSDLGELAARALAGTLSSQIGDAVPGLFGATPEDVRIETRRLSWSKGIATLTRVFFGELVSGSLSYWLDRTLALQVGEHRRFGDITARGKFDVALADYSSEATRIIQEFSGGWYGKTLHEKGRIDTPDAAAFGAVAMKKIVEELRARREP